MDDWEDEAEDAMLRCGELTPHYCGGALGGVPVEVCDKTRDSL